jgi:hypothetical protein
MALFHGPAAVIGKNSTDHYITLDPVTTTTSTTTITTGTEHVINTTTIETTTSNVLPNVEWVVQATQATVITKYMANESDGAQVHSNNQEGDFVLMALQHSAGDSGTGKIVVSGEAPFSNYKHMFYPIGEFDIPHNDYFIVANTMNWFAPMLSPVIMPAVHIVAPGVGDDISGEFILEWEVSQFHSPTYEFDVIVDGVVIDTVVGFEMTLNLASGQHELEIHATNLQGFSKMSESITIFVDNDAPMIDLTSTVADGGTTTSTSVDIDYNITDGSGSGVDTYEIFVDGVSYAMGDDTNATATLSLSGLTFDTHTVKFVASDEVANSYEVEYMFTVVDLDSPVILLDISIPFGAITVIPFDIDYNITDGTGIGISSWTIYLDDVPIASGTAANMVGTITLSTIASGSHTLQIVATDAAGNNAELSQTFEVDPDLPITITVPDPTTTTQWNTTTQIDVSTSVNTVEIDKTVATTTIEEKASSGFMLIIFLLSIPALILLRRRKN